MVTEEVRVYQSVVDRFDYAEATKLLKFSPHEKQEEVLSTIASREFDVLTLACGRRFGKSELMASIASSELLIPHSQVLLVAPTFTNAKAIYDKVELAILKLGLKITSKDIKLLTFTLEFGQRIVCATPKSISNVLGFKYSLVVFDESQDVTGLMDLWENKIGPAQSDYGVQTNGFMYSKTMFIGTVRDFDNDFYIPFERGDKTSSAKRDGYVSFNFPTSANPYIPKAYLEKKKAELPIKIFEMEHEGKWQQLKGDLVYYAFKESSILPYEETISRLLQHPNNLFLVGLDFGYSDNTGWLLGIVEKFTGNIYIISEYKAEQLSLKDHAINFKQQEQQNRVGTNILRWGDPSAAQQIHDLASTHSYYIFPAINDIDSGVITVNSYFHQEKLFILSNCVNLISEVKNMVWKNPKTKEVQRTKRFKHFDLALSSLRYLVFSWDKQKEMNIIVV